LEVRKVVQRKKPVIQEQVQHVPKAGGDLGLVWRSHCEKKELHIETMKEATNVREAMQQ